MLVKAEIFRNPMWGCVKVICGRETFSRVMATKEKKKEELYYFCKKAAAMQEIRACDEVTDSSFLRQPERMSSLDSDDNFGSG